MEFFRSTRFRDESVTMVDGEKLTIPLSVQVGETDIFIILYVQQVAHQNAFLVL